MGKASSLLSLLTRGKGREQRIQHLNNLSLPLHLHLYLYLSSCVAYASNFFCIHSTSTKLICVMTDRIPPGSYFHYPPSASPHRSSSIPPDRDSIRRYLAELFAEREKLGPFMQVMPLCSRLLNQEIRRLAGFNQSSVDHERVDHVSPYRSLGQHPNGRLMDLEVWSALQAEENRHHQRVAPFHASPIGWPGCPEITTTPIVKRVIRLDVPVEKYPNYNFVGRILGPRGNSLKRVESMTECRVYIRGQGSIKDSIKEEKLKDKPGYEHLHEPLHLLVEAEFSEDIINARLDHAVAVLENLLKPMDESLDHYKKQQLRELAMLNGTLREESPIMSPSMSPSMSPFNTTAMKRAKTGM